MSLTDAGPAGSPTFPDDPDSVLYGQLLRRARVTGRCPLWVTPEDLGYTLDRPEDLDELTEAIDGADGEAVLARWWPGPCHPQCPCGDPLPARIPQARVARPLPDLSRRPETFDAAVEFVEGYSCNLAVADAFRPADVPAVLGWAGACNYPSHDLVGMAAVLRYWERRWGAIVVDVSRSRMTLSVARPPMYDDECEQVAGEHFAFCPDQQDPQNGTVHSLNSYARTIRGKRSWHFWWD